MWLTVIKMWGETTVYETSTLEEAKTKTKEWVEKTLKRYPSLFKRPWIIKYYNFTELIMGSEADP